MRSPEDTRENTSPATNSVERQIPRSTTADKLPGLNGRPTPAEGQANQPVSPQPANSSATRLAVLGTIHELQGAEGYPAERKIVDPNFKEVIETMRSPGNDIPSLKGNSTRRAELQRIRGERWLEKRRQRVLESELQSCRLDPRKAKTIRGDEWIVCLRCGLLCRNVSRHLVRHGLSDDSYKSEYGYNKGTSLGCNALAALQAKNAKRTRNLKPGKGRAHLRPPQKGRVIALEYKLNRRTPRRAMPELWKRTPGGEVVTNAKLARLFLAGAPDKQIAEKFGMSASVVNARLWSMHYRSRARVFTHGEPVTMLHFSALCSDFGLSTSQVSALLGVGGGWWSKRLRGDASVALPRSRALRLLEIRSGLLKKFRRQPASGRRGGRPKPLPPSDDVQLAVKYNSMHSDLKTLRTWIRKQPVAPTERSIWDWLCDEFRHGSLRFLQFSPQFFEWMEDNYDRKSFYKGVFTPHELALQFTAADYDISESTLSYRLTHKK